MLIQVQVYWVLAEDFFTRFLAETITHFIFPYFRSYDDWTAIVDHHNTATGRDLRTVPV